MICKCGETGVLNEVLNQQFYYCRTCKIEISLEIKNRSAEAFDPLDFSDPDWAVKIQAAIDTLDTD